MPEQQGISCFRISLSVAVFLLISAICCMLSLSSPYARTGHPHKNTTEKMPEQKIKVHNYVPNLAMLCVMATGIVAMIVCIIKRSDLTSPDNQTTHRHKILRNISLWSITAFFSGGLIFDINYLIVEISCHNKWAHCDNEIVILNNSFEVAFHIVCIVFTSCETIICWIMKRIKFSASVWVWLGLAVVQAANVSLWFDSILKEWVHRVNENTESFEAYFNFCDDPALMNQRYNKTVDEGCTESSIAARWFVLSVPFLFPITIEFSLLVSETFLDKVVGHRPVNANENETTENPNETTPLLGRISTFVGRTFSAIVPTWNRAPTPVTAPALHNSIGSQIFIIISVIATIVYLLLAILVFVGYKIYDSTPTKIEKEWQVFKDVYTVFFALYLLFLNTCLFIGIICCRKFKHEYAHTTFLEYLLLFSTCGVLAQIIKRFIAFCLRTDDWNPAFVTVEILNAVQVILQIVFYYCAKDVKLQLTGDNVHQADGIRTVSIFKIVLIVMVISNSFMWINDSFFYPEMSNDITPSYYQIAAWYVFDNVVNPIAIFFRYNSALLFWCINTNINLLLRRR